MVLSVVYVKGQNLKVEQPEVNKIKINGFLNQASFSIINHGESTYNSYQKVKSIITLGGLALTIKYNSDSLVIVEGNIKYFEVDSENKEISLHYELLAQDNPTYNVVDYLNV